MNTRAAFKGLAILALGAACTPSLAAESAEAKQWLERMSQALATRNYDGKFFHLRGEQTETLRIIHRVDGRKVTERLVALDGSGREVIRNETEVVCYLPDRKLVLVEQRTGDGPLFGALPSYSEGLDDHYDIEAGKLTKLLGRKSQVITVKPKDEFRYGYTLWIDHETSMPLKTQLMGHEGQVIEEILFATIDLPERIPLASLQPETSAEGFRWFRQAVLAPDPSSSESWRVPKLPTGFRLTDQRVQAATGGNAAIQHLVFSDGLASVSVFIEPSPRSATPLHGLSRMGSAFAFSTEVSGHQVTAVGEVPALTVQIIAGSVQAGRPPAARAPQPAAKVTPASSPGR
jgi:sigma-E factor negative regulatory protein RseB